MRSWGWSRVALRPVSGQEVSPSRLARPVQLGQALP